MTPAQDWAANVLAVLAALAAAWQATRAGRQAKSGKETVEEVKELAAPTGEGFAGDVLGKLDGIATSQADLTRRMDRLEDAMALHLQVHAMTGGGRGG